MIILELTVRPKPEKYLEFSQSLESIKPGLEHCCTSLQITEQNNEFLILIRFDSATQLKTALRSKKFGILSGAVKILAGKSDITIQGLENKNEWPELKSFLLNFQKTRDNIQIFN